MIKKQIRSIFTSWIDVILAALIGSSVAVSVYLSCYQRHFFSKRYLLYTIIIGFAAALISGWLNKNIIFPNFTKLKKSIKIFTAVILFVFELMILVNIQPPPVYALIPKTDLLINFQINSAQVGGQPVRLLWIKNPQGYVHYSQLQIEGAWDREEKNLVFSPDQTVHIRWRGAVEPYIEIAFRRTNVNQTVEIEWAGNLSEINISNAENPGLISNVIIPLESEIAIQYYLPFMISFIFATSFMLFSLLMFLSNLRTKKSKEITNPHRWLLYAFPMLLIWTIVLMIFWPGIMTNDSFGQWEQMATGNFNDWQSAVYSLLILFLTHIWKSPAVVALAQIISLALVTAYGLKIFEENGANPIVMWGLSLLFAFLPVNMIFMSTIWKDIPYATSFLWLTTILLQIYLSNGVWIKNWKHVVTLSISAVCVALFRKNGVAVSVSVLIILIFVYFQNWKTYSASAALFIFLYSAVTGPLYSAMQIADESTGQSNLIFLHHIAAHVDAGNELTDEEAAYLGSFLPLSEWDYSCYYVGPISYDKGFNRQAFLDSGKKNLSLAINLFIRNPLVDIKHTFCASELVWRISNSHGYMKSTHGFNSWEKGKEKWIIPNEFGINEASLFPQLIKPFITWLRGFGFADDCLVWYLRPALYLYLTLFSMSVVFLRYADWRVWIVGVPVFSQSAILFLISFAPAFRYQYGTCLAGLLLLGLLFLSPQKVLASED